MPIADDVTASSNGIKKPRKPRAPRTTSIAPVPAKVTPRISRPVTTSQPLLRAHPYDVATRTPTVTRQPLLRGPRQPMPMGPPAPDTNAMEVALNYMKSIMAPRERQDRMGTFTQSNFPSPTLRSRGQAPEAPEAPESPEITNVASVAGTEYKPYSNYAEGLQGNYSNYARGLAANGGYDAINSDSPANPDRTPSQILTDKEIRRRLSRRGGMGIFNPISPVQGFDLNADNPSFGPRVHPVHGRTSNHTGEDYSAAMGTQVVAPVGGVVKSVTPNAGAYGMQVVVDHGNGEETMYAHLSDFAVQPGDKVKKGQPIGSVGNTGLSTGPHLHWETWKDGQALDPNTIWDREIPQDVLQAAAQRFGGRREVPQSPEGPSGPPPQQNNNELAGNHGLNALMQAIREQESGGDYGVQNGIGAMGAYQVMPSNIEGPAGWDMEVLGQNITGQQFLSSPELQNKIAKFKLKDYFKKYGAGGAAKAWYAGPGNATLSSSDPQYGGPSVNAYADNVLALMQKYMN